MQCRVGYECLWTIIKRFEVTLTCVTGFGRLFGGSALYLFHIFNVAASYFAVPELEGQVGLGPAGVDVGHRMYSTQVGCQKRNIMGKVIESF